MVFFGALGGSAEQLTMRLGAHMPATGGLDKAVLRGAEIGCDAIQVFTKAPSQWRGAPLREEVLVAYREALRATKIHPVIVHDAYLINLAAPNSEVLQRSREAFREEMERADAIGALCLVTHMGSHLGEGEAVGLRRLIESLKLLLDQTGELQVKVALETTAGQGTSLGYRFEHLGAVLAGLDWSERLVACMDTCHVFAAGYELRTREGYLQTMRELEKNIGRERVVAIHANDSKKPLGSRVDRHAHIGGGEIGEAGFVNVLTDRRWNQAAVILETPESETMHAVNLLKLRQLANG